MPLRSGWVDLAMLIAAIDEAAQRVGEQDLPRTAAALYGIALRESRARPMGDPVRAMAAAYARGAAEAVDELQARRHRPRCAPLYDLPGLAFHVARRELRGEGPPPWSEWRPRLVIPRASRPAPPAGSPPGAGAVHPMLEVAPQAGRGPEELRGEELPTPVERPPRAVAAAGPDAATADPAAWEALDVDERARAEALVRHHAPALARWTRGQGAVWRQAVAQAAAGLAAGEGEGLS